MVPRVFGWMRVNDLAESLCQKVRLHVFMRCVVQVTHRVSLLLDSCSS